MIASSHSLERASVASDVRHSWQLGPLTISRGLQVGDAIEEGLAALLIPEASSLTVHEGNLDKILRPPFDLLYRSPGSHSPRPSPFKGWSVSVAVEELAQMAAELSNFQISPGRFRRRLGSSKVVQPRLHPERSIVSTLQQLLQLSDSEGLHQEHTLEWIGLERVLLRLLALLLCGDVIRRQRQAALCQQSSKAQIMDDLVRWIQGHLDQPIQLNDLARQSGYSERSLRNLFHERFGCGPVQWIRSQRMQAAREQLLNPQPGDSVSSIAMTLGYQHLSQFSRDFQSTYGMRPSDILREGLRGRD